MIKMNGKADEISNGLRRNLQKKQTTLDDYVPVPNLPLLAIIATIAFFSTLSFVFSVNGGFVFDDSEAIVNNKDVDFNTPIWDVFFNDFWGSKLNSSKSHKSYRPLTIISFRWNAYIDGGLISSHFRVTNLILHSANSLLSLLVFDVLLNGTIRDIFTTRLKLISPKTSFLASLIFAIHPIHAESVAGIVGRAELLACVFFFISFLCYVQHCFNTSVGVMFPKNAVFSYLSMLFAAVAMLCKEQAITVLGFSLLFDCLTTLQQPKTTSNFKPFLVRVALIITVGCFVLYFRWYIMGNTIPVFREIDNPSSFQESLVLRVLNYNYVYALNLWILILPTWLCFDWSMGCVPLIEDFVDIRILTVVLLWGVFISMSFRIILRFNSLARVLTMSIALMVVPFIPASNAFFHVGFVIAERVLYIPSAGFCLLVTVGVCRLNKHLKTSSMVIKSGLYVALISMLVRSVQRSLDWTTEERLFRSGLDVCPLNAKVHYNVAKNAADSGNADFAIAEYVEAIRLNPNYEQAMNNLGNILKDRGNLVEAEKLLLRAVQIRDTFAAAWMNLGIVQVGLKKYSEAEISYQTAIQHRQNYTDCYYNIGNLYVDINRTGEAYESWMKAISLKPTHSPSWNNIIIMLDNIGDPDNLFEIVMTEALAQLPGDATLHYNIANALGRRGRNSESEKHFLQAIYYSNETNAAYFSNLGVLYHRWKRYRDAETAYKRALEVNPNFKSAKDNLRTLEKALTKGSIVKPR